MVNHKKAGIMLLTVLIFTAFLVLITGTIAKINIINLQKSNIINKSNLSSIYSNTCAEEALFRLKNSATYIGGTLNYNNQTCTINISGTDPNKTIEIEIIENKITKNLIIETIISTNENYRSIKIINFTEQ